MDTIRLRAPAEMLATLPYQLGFHPRDALVVVTMRGTRVGLVARVDLPPEEHVAGVVSALLPGVLREDPSSVLLVGYDRKDLPCRPLVEAVAGALRAEGVPVHHCLVVRDGRWSALHCRDGCCPAGEMPLPRPEDCPAVAQFVGLEVGPLPARESLAESLAPDPRLSGAVARALPAVRERWPAAGGPREHAHQRSVRRLTVLSRWSALCDTSISGAPVDRTAPEDAALLLASLRDVALRDGLIAWLCPGTLPLEALDEDLVDALASTLGARPGPTPGHSRADAIHHRRLISRLSWLCRAAPGDCAAPVLTVLAGVAWSGGDGALAGTALERALAAEPGYRLALLLERMVALAIRPDSTRC